MSCQAALLTALLLAPAGPRNVLAWYNAAAATDAELLPGWTDDAAVRPGRLALNGWGYSSLVVEPAARRGRLAAFEEAAPLGFSRADLDATVAVPARALPAGATLSGVLEPVDLRFRQPAAVTDGLLRIPLPVASLPPGDYRLRLCLRAGGETELAELPVVVGPYLRRDAFQTYTWNAGGSTEAELAAQIALAKLAGVSVLDTAYLPAATALREGLFVSAHYVTIYQGHVPSGHAAEPPYLAMAEEQAAAIGELARRYRHLLWCLPNSEYGSDRILATPGFETALRDATGLALSALKLETTDYPIPRRDLPALSPGVYRNDLPELVAHRFARRHGQGWFEVNRRSMATTRERAPWLTMWTDPVFTTEQFEGLDAVSFWQYSADPFVTVAQAQRAECARRINGATGVFLTLSQWYESLGREGGWALRSPDQHRFDGWHALALPIDALGYWEVGELPANPDCADALRDSLRQVVMPLGTLLRGAEPAPAPVAVYVSSDGEFLARAHRPHNYWFHTHYLNVVMPAIFERFGGQVEWLDDADVLAGRLSRYRLVLCPLFAATTEPLLRRLREYQQAGGVLAGDELWGVAALQPDLRFPAKSTEALGLPYANESLPAWHAANRAAVLAWQPGLTLPFALTTDAPEVIAALKTAGDTRFVALANGRFERGAFAEKHGYTNPRYRDQGVPQAVGVTVAAADVGAVYDVARGRRLAPEAVTREGDQLRLTVALDGGGGALLALRRRPITALELSAEPVRAAPGTIVTLRLRVSDEARTSARQTAARLTIRDSAGTEHDASGVVAMPDGTADVRFAVPLNADPGHWRLAATDLTSGLRRDAAVEVVRRDVARP